MFTPDESGPTGILVYENGSSPMLQAPLSWSTAPQPVAGAAGSAEDASTGSWHSWDITSMAQGWLADDSTSNGVTLSGAGAPIRFSTAADAGTGTPETAPYVTVVYSQPDDSSPAPAGQAQAMSQIRAAASAAPTPDALDDGAKSVYGVAGTLVADGEASELPYCSGERPPLPGCDGALQPSMIAAKWSPQATGLGASYVRVAVNLECDASLPNNPDFDPASDDWWSSSNDSPVTEVLPPTKNKTWAVNPSTGSLDLILKNVIADGLTPVLDILPDVNCHSYLTPEAWKTQVASLVNYIHTNNLIPANKWIDFEIGNEENMTPGLEGADICGWNHDDGEAEGASCPLPTGCVHVGSGSGEACVEHVPNSDFCKTQKKLLPVPSDGKLIVPGCFWVDMYNGNFTNIFAAAAVSLDKTLQAAGVKNYRIMPGGVLNPATSKNPITNTGHNATDHYFGGSHPSTPVLPNDCGAEDDFLDPANNFVPYDTAPSSNNSPIYNNYRDVESNLDMVSQAIQAAVNKARNDSDSTLNLHLAVAVHPYAYESSNLNYFRNFNLLMGINSQAKLNTATRCSNLGNMLNTWIAAFPTYPIFFTEVNYNGADTSPGVADIHGAYVIDLITWLSDNNSKYRVLNASASPLRVLVFNGADIPGQPYGFYGPFAKGGEKLVTVQLDTEPYGTPSKRRYKYCHISSIVPNPSKNAIVTGTHPFSQDFYDLNSTTNTCY